MSSKNFGCCRCGRTWNKDWTPIDDQLLALFINDLNTSLIIIQYVHLSYPVVFDQFPYPLLLMYMVLEHADFPFPSYSLPNDAGSNPTIPRLGSRVVMDDPFLPIETHQDVRSLIIRRQCLMGTPGQRNWRRPDVW